MKFFVIFFLIVGSMSQRLVAVDPESVSQDDETCTTPGDDCEEETDHTAKLMNLANRVKYGNITKLELHSELMDIMEDNDSPGSYYSMGFETGIEPGIVFARQDMYRFASKLKIPLSLPVRLL